jgi:S1-C subfamily serine protease
VGANPQGVASTDAKGRFVLRELPEGTVALEAYAPDRGRARVDGIRVTSGRTTSRARIAFGAAAGHAAPEPAAPGSVAVTLGETGDPTEVVVVSLVEGSEAERSGLAPGDVLVAVDGTAVSTMEDARAKLSGPLAADVVLRVRRGDQTLSLRVGREAVRR